MGLEAGILAFWLGLGPKEGISALWLGFGPFGWNLGLEAGIWAERWRRAGTKKEEEKEEEEEEKFLHM